MTIAEKLIRAKTDLDEVYTAGYEKGKSEVIPSGDYSQGFEAGKQAEYDAFWDAFQDSGNRTDYNYAFAGSGWRAGNFKPKYSIKPSRCGQLFGSSVYLSVDLVSLFNSLGITLDLSDSIDVTYLCRYSAITRIGTVDGTKASSWAYSFANATNLETIDLMVVNETHTYSNTFTSATSLKYITFSGTIGQSISFAQSSLLEVSSMDSIYEHLKNYTSASSGTYTLTLHASAWARWGEAKPDIAAQYGGSMKNYVTATKGWGAS